jgi:hypothetical protein
MAMSCDRPLDVLPFDPRGTIPKNMFGRSVTLIKFWGPPSDWKDGRIAREAAVSEIARRYRESKDIFGAAARRGGGA